MALIRKDRAGSDSHGHRWPEDGAVVEVAEPGHVAALVAIPDGGFTEVTAREPEFHAATAAGAAGPEAKANTEALEGGPTAVTAKPAGRRGRTPAPRG